MDKNFQNRFITLWRKYFNNAELPFTFYYTDETDHAPVATKETPRCVIASMVRVRQGNTLVFDAQTVGCPGGRRYLGFTENITPDFEYFLSYGIEGRMRGERYIKSPELVKQMQKEMPRFKAPAKYIVFKRWDKLDTSDNPEVVAFIATPDVLAGLFTLSRFDNINRDAVATPFGAGCSSIVQYPYLEKDSANPRAIIGLFDPSARPHIPKDTLSFAVPFHKFTRMIDNMEESFLITETWQTINKRIP
jgi:uncharacterized protein (DUF169 family)